MLKHFYSPVFPRLVFLKEASFGSWSSKSNKTSKVYKIDWNAFDSEINKRHQDWNKRCWPSKDIPIVQKFDTYYENILQRLSFAIPNNYMTEIHYMSQQALIEWNKERHFDTDIREMCLKPSIKYIECAFKLLCDCTYDENTNYFYRAENEYLLAPLLLFRFWQHQTGSGCIQDHAGFDDLKQSLDFYKSRKGYEEHVNNLFKFLTFFDNQTVKIEESKKVIMEEACPTVSSSGPTVTDGSSMNIYVNCSPRIEKKENKFI